MTTFQYQLVSNEEMSNATYKKKMTRKKVKNKVVRIGKKTYKVDSTTYHKITNKKRKRKQSTQRELLKMIKCQRKS